MTERALEGRRVLLGVTGGIAAYKTPELVRQLVERGADVQVVMTPAARQFVAPLALQVVSRRTVVSDLFARSEGAEVRHIAMAREADLALIAPATANLLGKLAHGIADDPVTTVFLAVTAPTLIAPAMNDEMWRHPAVAAAVERLEEWRYRFVGPEEGFLAEGYAGVGRMSEPETIAATLAAMPYSTIARAGGGAPGDLDGVRVLITAGPTREHLDPVRFLSNPSSGRMGYALAAEAAARGARVTLVSGPAEISAPAGVELVRVTSAEEMLAASQRAFATADVFIAAAAVADFRPARRFDHKQKKATLDPHLELEPTPDILETLARDKGERFVVGFAAETENVIASAHDKLLRKHADLVVANDVGMPDIGFAAEENQVSIVAPDGSVIELDRAAKRTVAGGVWDAIVTTRKA